MRKYIRGFFVIAVASALMGGFSQAVAQAPPAVAPLPTSSRWLPQSKIYPLSKVHRGLVATAYTVFEGSKPEPMEVKILGVLHDAIGPGKDMILGQLVGGQGQEVGVAAGMSGSPVYFDGRLMGAIGYRIGQFTRNPIAGITPIEQILEVGATAEVGSTVEAAGNASEPAAAGAEASTEAVPASSTSHSPAGALPGQGMLHPIETPLIFSGFSPEAIDLFKRHASSLGLTPVSGLGGANPGSRDAAPVVPGSEISAILVSGDFNMAASCTVTYVDPKHLLACGHSITRFGRISLPMSKAVVVDTVASPLAPMKIINTTETVGSFTEDQQSGILGVFGEPARMIPVTMEIRGIANPHTYHFAVADHPRLTPASLISTVYQAIEDTNGPDEPATYNLQGKIVLNGYPTIRIDDWVAPSPSEKASVAVAALVSRRFGRIFQNPGKLPPIQGVVLNLDAMPGDRAARLVDARVLNPVIHAGDRVEVEAVLRPYRRPRRTVHLSVQLPDTLPAGPVRLLISDGATLDHTLHLIPDPTAPPPGLRVSIAQLNALHSSNRLYVTLLAPSPQASTEGRELPAVPLTIANVLQPDPDSNAAGFQIHGETAIPILSKPLNVALSGFRVTTLDIRP